MTLPYSPPPLLYMKTPRLPCPFPTPSRVRNGKERTIIEAHRNASSPPSFPHQICPRLRSSKPSLSLSLSLSSPDSVHRNPLEFRFSHRISAHPPLWSRSRRRLGIRERREDAEFDRHLQREPLPDCQRGAGHRRRARGPPVPTLRRWVTGLCTSATPAVVSDFAPDWFSHRQWGWFRTPGRGMLNLWRLHADLLSRAFGVLGILCLLCQFGYIWFLESFIFYGNLSFMILKFQESFADLNLRTIDPGCQVDARRLIGEPKDLRF